MHRTRLTPQQQAQMLQQQQQQQQPQYQSQYAIDAPVEENTARTQAAPPRSARQPHYALPTTSTVLPEYANSEADVIRASFTTGNYRLISHLPNELKAHHVSEATASRIDDNITSAHFVAPHGSVRRLGGRGNDALFSTFDYKPEQYDRAVQLQTEMRKQQEERRLQVNPLPFLYSTPRPVLTNALAGALPHAAPGADPFEGSNTSASRQAFLEHQGLLHGPFVPSGGSRTVGEDRVIRLKLPEIVARLLRALDEDWADAHFQVYVDEDDLIMVQFAVASVDGGNSSNGNGLRGLQSYMNMFVKTAPVVSEFQLAKLPELWHHVPADADGNIYYALRPPWVRRRAEESMFALHPELSTAGGTFQKQRRTGELKEQERAQLPSAGPLLLTAGSSNGGNAAAAPAASASLSGAAAGGEKGGSRLLTAEERERMHAMMASFDAGVQPLAQRKQPGPGAWQGRRP